jgi:hypothetical protein
MQLKPREKIKTRFCELEKQVHITLGALCTFNAGSKKPNRQQPELLPKVWLVLPQNIQYFLFGHNMPFVFQNKPMDLPLQIVFLRPGAKAVDIQRNAVVVELIVVRGRRIPGALHP